MIYLLKPLDSLKTIIDNCNILLRMYLQQEEVAERTDRMQGERQVRMAEMERERFSRMRAERTYASEQQTELAAQRRQVIISIK